MIWEYPFALPEIGAGIPQAPNGAAGLQDWAPKSRRHFLVSGNSWEFAPSKLGKDGMVPYDPPDKKIEANVVPMAIRRNITLMVNANFIVKDDANTSLGSTNAERWCNEPRTLCRREKWRGRLIRLTMVQAAGFVGSPGRG